MTVLSNIITPSNVLTTTNTATVTNKTFGDNPTFSAGTANGVTYLNGSKVLTSGSALVFDGTNFSTTGTAKSNANLFNYNTSYWNVDGHLSNYSATNGVYLNGNASGWLHLNGDGTNVTKIQIYGSSYTTPNIITFSTASSVRATLDASGNLGLGVTPSAWNTSNKAFQFSSSGVLFGETGNTYLGSNIFVNSSGDNRYITTNFASMYRQVDGKHLWYTAASGTAGNSITFTEALTLQNVSQANLTLRGTNASMIINSTNGVYPAVFLATSGTSFAQFAGDGTNLDIGANGYLRFMTNGYGTERARIDTSGNLLVGKTSDTFSVSGARISSGGVMTLTTSSNELANFNRLTNDGALLYFSQDSTIEGSISVSGTTVSYNGGHLSRYAQTTIAKDDSLLKGTVLSNLDEMNVYTKDGQPVDNEQLNKVKVSDTEGDVNVAGVFVNWSHDEDHNVDEINMAMTGDMIIRIAQGVTVVRGDLLMSAGDGTAKPQGDDIIRSKTVAKVTSNHVTCTYADGSYCVPCVLMAC